MNEFELFQLALDIEEPSARQLFLKNACLQNAELLHRVEALLTSHDGQSQFLNRPVVEQIGELDDSASVAKMPDGNRITHHDELDATYAHPHETAHISDIDAADDEILLGYLQPSTKPGTLGRLAHYEVLEVVGRGAFGTVLRAFDEKLQRMVAIKVMALELAATSPARKRFMREAQASAAIRHENVVSVYAVEEKPLPYLVMEYIPGRTLQHRLNERGPLDVPTVLRLGRQIAEGLAAAHAQELIHRDIKPGNILLETAVHDRVKITDFGLARAADDASLTQSGTIAGSPMYMAPEQALGRKLDQRADLFSFGSVLYQMISGRPPFRAPSALAVLKRVVEETPRPIREIIHETPQWLCDIISKLHAKNPDDRYQSAREIADVLARCESQYQAHSGLKDFSLIPQTETQPSGQRRKMTLAIIAVLALSLLTYGLIALIRPPVKNTMSGNEIAHLATPDPLKIEGALALGKATEQRINDADGWVQLFNGKDLTGWKFHPDHQGDWEVKEGILKGSSRSSHLFSQRGDYANFHLRAEVQVNWGGDSGILFRTPFELERVSTANAITIPVGYEVDIQEYRSHPWRTGSILQVQNDASPIRLGAVTENTLTQPDEWFTVEVIAVDNRFITKINGQETANCDDPFNRHSLGYLALQVWNPDTIVQYRKIEIKELPPSNSLRVDQGKRHFASDEWIDVIPLIDPRFDRWHVPKQTGKNDWRIEQNELVVARDVNASKLILPLDSDWSAFELEFEFTRRGGNSGFNVNLPTEFGECPLVVDAPGYSGGLSLGAKTKGKLLQIGAQIVTSERTMMHLEVHRQQDVDRVLVDLNGARIGEWSGDCNSISAKSYEGFPSDRRVSLWIFGGGNEFVFHRIRVRLLDGGTAESLRPAPTVALIPVTQLPVTQPPSGR